MEKYVAWAKANKGMAMIAVFVVFAVAAEIIKAVI
jgi:hypothetical protein